MSAYFNEYKKSRNETIRKTYLFKMLGMTENGKEYLNKMKSHLTPAYFKTIIIQTRRYFP